MDDLGRRAFLRRAGGVGLLALVPALRLRALAAVAPAAGEAGRFLSAHELDTLRAVTARLLPGPPEDSDPGALEAGAAEAIDLFLGAFTVDPPLIHAGRPFSDRAGGARDDLADFVPLDRLAELGWRIRLEGSLGKPEREFAGPVRGLQQIYREGLAHLDERAAPAAFTDLPAPLQDALLRDQSDDAVQELVEAALADTLHAVYGLPEYGGNRDLVGWEPIGWRGDVQPRGYTRAEVSDPDPSGSVITSRAAARRALDRFMPAAAAAAHPSPAARWWA